MQTLSLLDTNPQCSNDTLGGIDTYRGIVELKNRIRELCRKTSGFLGLLKSVKPLGEARKGDRLYRMTLRRFHDSCLKLEAFSEALALVAGKDSRDQLLKDLGCRWDAEKRRVMLPLVPDLSGRLVQKSQDPVNET